MKTKIFAIAVAATIGLALSACSPAEPTPIPTLSNRIGENAAAIAALPTSIEVDGVLTIAIDPTYAPNESTDSIGNPVGWEVELGNAIGARLGLRVQYTAVPFDTILNVVQSGKYDLALSSIFTTPDRVKSIDMLEYYQAGTQWADRIGGGKIRPDDACGLIVAVQGNTYQANVDLPARSHACTVAGKDKIQILTYTQQSDVVEAVTLGYADALVADSPVAQYAVKANPTKLEVNFEPYDFQTYGVGIAQGNSLSKAVQLAIQSLMDDGKYDEILTSWGVEDGALDKVTLKTGN